MKPVLICLFLVTSLLHFADDIASHCQAPALPTHGNSILTTWHLSYDGISRVCWQWPILTSSLPTVHRVEDNNSHTHNENSVHLAFEKFAFYSRLWFLSHNPAMLGTVIQIRRRWSLKRNESGNHVYVDPMDSVFIHNSAGQVTHGAIWQTNRKNYVKCIFLRFSALYQSLYARILIPHYNKHVFLEIKNVFS